MGLYKTITFLILNYKNSFCLNSLQIFLLSDVERVRAASIRALRYLIHRVIIFDKFLEYRLDSLVCR
jgi:hypothetical protein